MTETDTHLGTVAVPIALYGADESSVTIAIEIVFPTLPLKPFSTSRTVEIRDDQ